MITSLSPFFLLTYLLYWRIWIPLAVNGGSSQLPFWLAGFAPTLMAILLTASQSGRAGLRGLLQMGWRVKPHWYLISLLGTPLAMLIALGLNILFGGEPPQYLDPNHPVTSLEQLPLVVVVILYVFVSTALGEEVGWRGYGLSRLQTHFSPFLSSLILGLIWTCWHPPLFRMSNNFHQQLPLTWFLLQVLGSTFIYTWMFNHTNGSLLIALLLHTSSNAAVGLLPVLPLDNAGSLRRLWLVVGWLWPAIGWIIWLDATNWKNSSRRAIEFARSHLL